jgi:hypothetical protein
MFAVSINIDDEKEQVCLCASEGWAYEMAHIICERIGAPVTVERSHGYRGRRRDNDRGQGMGSGLAGGALA